MASSLLLGNFCGSALSGSWRAPSVITSIPCAPGPPFSLLKFRRLLCKEPVYKSFSEKARIVAFARYPRSCVRAAEQRDFLARGSSRGETETALEVSISGPFSSQRLVVGEQAGTRTLAEQTAHLSLAPFQQDTAMLFVVFLCSYAWVRLFDFFTSRNFFKQKLSRKLIHITSGLLFIVFWPFFSNSPWAPFAAGLVPLLTIFRLLIYGSGILKDEGLVKSMSRSGDPKELLRGPLYYVLVLYASTVVFWRYSPVGVIALAMMCGGDGIADIVGRKYGQRKLPYNPNKSWAGSIAMFIFGFVLSFLFIQYLSAFGFYRLDISNAALRLAVISMASTVVESLPITSKLDDNFTVPVTAFALGVILFPK